MVTGGGGGGGGGYDFFLNWEKSHPTSNWEWDQFSSLGSHWWHCVVSPGISRGVV